MFMHAVTGLADLVERGLEDEPDLLDAAGMLAETYQHAALRRVLASATASGWPAPYDLAPAPD